MNKNLGENTVPKVQLLSSRKLVAQNRSHTKM